MITRTQSTKVVFVRPFILDGMETMQPPGSYTIDTDEEELDTMRTQGWRRIRTVMRIERAGATEFLTIDPEQLNKALTRDGAQQDPALPLSPAGPKARHDRARAVGIAPRKSAARQTAAETDAGTSYRLSRIQAEGWKAARALSASGLADAAAAGIDARNPYASDPERARWLVGFNSAL